jgi:hypothetical protein
MCRQLPHAHLFAHHTARDLTPRHAGCRQPKRWMHTFCTTSCRQSALALISTMTPAFCGQQAVSGTAAS